jgi:hypothetical protein
MSHQCPARIISLKSDTHLRPSSHGILVGLLYPAIWPEGLQWASGVALQRPHLSTACSPSFPLLLSAPAVLPLQYDSFLGPESSPCFPKTFPKQVWAGSQEGQAVFRKVGSSSYVLALLPMLGLWPVPSSPGARKLAVTPVWLGISHLPLSFSSPQS